MINPKALDIKTLPWLPLEEKAAFPKKPAIYFAIDSQETVQYIGRTVNVRQRWGNHHKYDALSEIGNVKIAYLFIDTVELLPKIEAALIEWFNPPLNNSLSSFTNTSEKINFACEPKSQRLNAILPDNVYTELLSLAEEEKRTKSQMAAILIEEALQARTEHKKLQLKKGKDTA